MWSVPLIGSAGVVDVLRRQGATLEPKAEAAVRQQRSIDKELLELSSAKDADFDTSLPLYPYQKVGAAFLKRVGSGLLGDDVGLGKTIQAMAVFDGWTLVLCPSALKYQWQGEVKKFKGETAIVIHGTKKQREEQWNQVRVQLNANVKNVTVIMNYELLIRDDFKIASQVKWNYIVADEATKASNPRAKQSKAIKKLRAEHKIALTGTPISNRAEELWNIIDWISPGVFDNYWNFQQRYCVKNHFGAIVSHQNLDELNQRLKRYMIRRTKDEVLPDLPEKISTDVPVKLSAKERGLYNQIREELLFEIEKEDISKVENPMSIQYTLVKMARLQQLADSMELLGEESKSSKLEALQEILMEIMADDERKAIIFTKFAEMADILKRELSEYNPLVISGKIKEKYQDQVDLFNNDDKYRVLILTSAGQYGLNIQRASAVIHFDQEWSLAKMVQRTGRAHRIGQTKKVLEYHLLAKGTLDMYVRRTLHEKEELSNTVLGDVVTFSDVQQMLNYEA